MKHDLVADEPPPPGLGQNLPALVVAERVEDRKLTLRATPGIMTP